MKEDAARPGVIRWGNRHRGELLPRGAAGLRLHRRPAHGGKTQLAQGGYRQGGTATREAAVLRLSRRSAHGRKTQLGPRVNTSLGKLRDAKRPACSERQTGACRSCGLAVSQPCRGREEPVETTDAFRPTGGGRGAESGPSLSPTARAIDSQPPDQCPASEAINSDSPDRCPVTEAINSQPPDGCPTGEGLITSTAGLDRGRRTSVNSVVSARAACEGPTSTPLRQHSLVGDRGRANHPPVMPVQQGSRTQGFYGRKPWKKPNSTLIIDGPRPAKEGLRLPFRKPPPDRSLKLPANPPRSRPGYRHRSPRLSLFRSSRFLSALRVS